MKKSVCICVMTLMALSALLGCSAVSTAGSDNAGGPSRSKVVINFEGMVAVINGDKVRWTMAKSLLFLLIPFLQVIRTRTMWSAKKLLLVLYSGLHKRRA